LDNNVWFAMTTCVIWFIYISGACIYGFPGFHYQSMGSTDSPVCSGDPGPRLSCHWGQFTCHRRLPSQFLCRYGRYIKWWMEKSSISFSIQ